MGGSIEARSASELPRNRRQVYNARQQSSTSSATDSTSSGSTRSDPIFEPIKQCKEDMLLMDASLLGLLALIPLQAAFLLQSLNWKIWGFALIQLNPVFLVCTRSLILGCSMSQLPLIVIFMLRIKIQASHLFPLDQYMFTQRRHYYESYHFFSTFLKLKPSLNDLIAIGTDGDPAMEKAIVAVFPESLIHLWCFIHMKDNIRHKLTELLLLQSVREDIIQHIFGVQHISMYTQGVLDAEDFADFDGRLASLQKQWEELEMTVHPCKQPCFYDWVLRYEAGVMKSSMIVPVRTSAGLACPPAKYTTNDNECLNNIAQAHADYSHCSWIEFMILWLCKARKWRRQCMGWASINSVLSMLICKLKALSGFENKWAKAKTFESCLIHVLPVPL